MSELPKRITSEELSKSLDYDYSEDKIKNRIEMYKKRVKNGLNKNSQLPCSYIIAGSKGEGLTYLFKNDVDIMLVYDSNICTENVESVSDTTKKVIVINRTGAPEGYCYLTDPDTKQTFDVSNEEREFKNWLTSVSDGKTEGPALHFSSKFKINILVANLFGNNIHSDLLTTVFKEWKVSFDVVPALPCYLPGMLIIWRKRARKYDWPSAETIEHVSGLQAHVVKVGLKQSYDEENQWRISFTLAEIHLIQSLNNTQKKVYVCLKRIAKHYLKPINNDITSYVMKNVVLWIAESMPSEQFKPEVLLKRIEDGLRFLKTSVIDKRLRNYMIPDRNLFINKLENNEPLLEAINKILPLELYKSEQYMSLEVRMNYSMMCIFDNLMSTLEHKSSEQMADLERRILTGGPNAWIALGNCFAFLLDHIRSNDELILDFERFVSCLLTEELDIELD